jgi:ATP-dependent DNA helicase RecG
MISMIYGRSTPPVVKVGLTVQRCRENGLPAPAWKSDPQLGVTVTFTTTEATTQVTTQVTTEVTPEVTTEVATEVRLANILVGEMSRQQLKQALNFRNDKHFRMAYLHPALEAGLIEMTVPDKPQSSKQKYRLTAKGKNLAKRGAK